MNTSCTQRSSVALLALIAAGCGGGDESDSRAHPAAEGQVQILSASMPTCSDARVHDNGTVVYVTIPASCEFESPIELTLTVDRHAPRDHTVRIESPGVESAFEPETGLTRRVSVFRRGTWRSLDNGASWRWRDGAGLLAKDGGLYLMGGWSGGVDMNSDVWFTRDLLHWIERTPRAPWNGRHGAGWVVHADRLWVIGGDLFTDVWSSTDGNDWRLETQAAAFGERYTPIGASLNGRLLIYGGMAWGPSRWCAYMPECFAYGFNDVWSSNDGVTWTAVQPAAPWTPRGLIHGSIVFNGRTYIIGGGLKLASTSSVLAETTAEHHDVWSSDDGVHWRQEADDAGFSPRTHLATLGTEHGCYIAGGSVMYQLAVTNEVYFAPDCVRFRLLPGYEQLGVRHAASIAQFNGSIVILGGHADTAGTTVWQYFPDI
ncbi:MAG: hypothetical protein JNJ42_19175 [Burkholderiaceae bacterium]|nr:hypothetical protein [Burkholderiaceae bacterium]